MSRIVALEDVELHVVDEGAGEVLLFVHGFPLDHSMWEHQLDEFSATHRVIAPDLRGFGQSEDSASPVTMEKYADDLAELLQVLEIEQPVTLIGLSMGGYIAWQFWKRHPEKLKRLVLCDTRAQADAPEGKQARIDNAQKVQNEGPGFLAASMPEKFYSPQTRAEQPELFDAAQRTILQTSPMGISAALFAMAARPDVTAWLPEIQVPTLVVVGEADVISPVAEMREIAERLPQATLAVIPHAAHLAPQEQPELVNQAIRNFIASHR